ncbi:MAG: tRNA pseudouridine(38-40) synthase TruA [Lentisphaeria bacterium]|nr:tRNA pseudouridine(38-40) synthase TruA [Lentisphaeria bacterium]
MGIEPTPFVPAKRYLMEIAFDGGNYSGWQIQPHCLAVQQVIQEHLTKMYDKQPIHLIGSSRTDAGVHAQNFAASFLVPEQPAITIERLFKALNRRLPPDIKIHTIKEVPLAFHARYDTFGKAYTYVLNLGEDSPFVGRYAWHPWRKLDVSRIRLAAERLVGTHDYSSFVVERKEIDDAVRTIYRINVDEIGQFCCITFVGNGFLYKMIRCLMGMIEAVGAGVATPDDVTRILEARDRTAAPETAPGNGLFLMKVFYSEEERSNFKFPGLPFLY